MSYDFFKHEILILQTYVLKVTNNAVKLTNACASVLAY